MNKEKYFNLYIKYKTKYLNLKRNINQHGGTIFIKKKGSAETPFDEKQYQYKKGRSKPDDQNLFHNNNIDFDIDLSWKTTSYNEAMILYYILEATSVHRPVKDISKSHLEYKYIIMPSNPSKEYSFNIFEFLSGIKKDSDRFNCRLFLKEDFETDPNTNKIIYMKDIWNELNLNSKKIIVQCMALSIHYRIDQQYFFWKDFFKNYANEEEKELIKEETINTLIAFNFLKLTRFMTTNLETFVRHYDVIFQIYSYYKEIIGEDIELLNILDGKETISTMNPLWTNFYERNSIFADYFLTEKCTKCKQIYSEQIKERQEEIIKEGLREEFIEKNGSNEGLPLELMEGKLYVPKPISSPNLYNRIKTIDNIRFTLKVEIIKKINDILEITSLNNQINEYDSNIKKEELILEELLNSKKSNHQILSYKINKIQQERKNKKPKNNKNNMVNLQKPISAKTQIDELKKQLEIENKEFDLKIAKQKNKLYLEKENNNILKFQKRIEMIKNNLTEIEKIIFDKKIKEMSNKEIYKIQEILIRFDNSYGIKPL